MAPAVPPNPKNNPMRIRDASSMEPRRVRSEYTKARHRTNAIAASWTRACADVIPATITPGRQIGVLRPGGGTTALEEGSRRVPRPYLRQRRPRRFRRAIPAAYLGPQDGPGE